MPRSTKRGLLGITWIKLSDKFITMTQSDAIKAMALNSDSLKIQCIDMNMYRIVQKYCGFTKTEFHSYAVPENGTLKVVIKGILSHISASEVADELKFLRFEIKHVKQFGSLVKKNLIHMISLALNPSIKCIFNLNSLFYMYIYFAR